MYAARIVILNVIINLVKNKMLMNSLLEKECGITVIISNKYFTLIEIYKL